MTQDKRYVSDYCNKLKDGGGSEPVYLIRDINIVKNNEIAECFEGSHADLIVNALNAYVGGS